MTSDLISFSGNNLSTGAGLIQWREYLAEAYCRQDVRLLDKDPIPGFIKRRSVAGLNVSSFRSGGEQQVWRTEKMAAADGIEHFHFVFPQRGQFLFRQGPIETCVGRGGSFIINASGAFGIKFSRYAKSTVFAVPCDHVRNRVIGIDDFARKHRLSDPFYVAMLSSIGAKLLNHDIDADPLKLHDLCIDLICLSIDGALRCNSDGSRSSRQTRALLDKARKVVDEHLTDPAFDLTALAAACDVSKRKIQRALSSQSTSFGQYLLNKRLSRAHDLLSKRNNSARIGQIASECGFSNQSHFSSSFRRRFGISPRDVK